MINYFFKKLSINLRFSFFLLLGWILVWFSFGHAAWQNPEVVLKFKKLLYELLITTVFIELCLKNKVICQFFYIKHKSDGGVFYTDLLPHLKRLGILCCIQLFIYLAAKHFHVNTLIIDSLGTFGLYVCCAVLATIIHHIIFSLVRWF